MNLATLFDQVTILTKPEFIWAIYGFIILISALMTMIFIYHWYFFNTSKPMFVLASIVYIIGLSIILITLFITLNLTIT